MNNPIILLVFWAVINLLIKSTKDKKKAEEAKRRRQNQGIPPQGPSTSPRHKSIIDVFKEEIEKEIQREKEAQKKKLEPAKGQAKPKPAPKREKSPGPPKREEAKPELNYMDKKEIGYIDEPIPDGRIQVVNVGSLSSGSSGRKLNLNVKKDLLRGIIYSEILSEPKGLRNLKR